MPESTPAPDAAPRSAPDAAPRSTPVSAPDAAPRSALDSAPRSAPLPEPLAVRVRALLRGADHPATAPGTPASWRSHRDHWLDRLDPSMPAELGESGIRDLIDFLSESGPSRSSRMTAAEWSRAVDALVPELLFRTR